MLAANRKIVNIIYMVERKFREARSTGELEGFI
jgi:hypothetical protein